MNFNKFTPGCACCGGTGGCDYQICTAVVACGTGALVASLSVNVSGPGLPGGGVSCTTAADGTCCVCVPGTGLYVVTVGGAYSVHVEVLGAGTTNWTFHYPTAPPTVCFVPKRCGTAVAPVAHTTPAGFTDAASDQGVCFQATGTQVVGPTVVATLSWPACDGSIRSQDFSVELPADFCSGTISQDFDVTEDGFTVAVVGCNGKPLPGATVVSSSGPSGTTGDDGTVILRGTPGGPVGTLTISHDRFDTRTVDSDGATYGCCQGLSAVTLAPADGYTCCVIPGAESDSCVTPVAKVMALTSGCCTVDLVVTPVDGGVGTPQCAWGGCCDVAGGGAATFSLGLGPGGWNLSVFLCLTDTGVQACTPQWEGTLCADLNLEVNCASPITYDATFDAGQPGCAGPFPLVLTGSLPASQAFPCNSGTSSMTVDNPCGGAFTISESP